MIKVMVELEGGERRSINYAQSLGVVRWSDGGLNKK